MPSSPKKGFYRKSPMKAKKSPKKSAIQMWLKAVKKAEAELGETRPVPMKKSTKFYKIARAHYDAMMA